MFPEDDNFEETSNVFEEVLTKNDYNEKAYLFDYKKGEFVLKNGAPVLVTGKEALKCWIEKCMRTVRFKAIVHEGLEYGPQLEDLIGSVFDRDFVQAEIERECTEALLKNPFITQIEEFSFELVNEKLTADIKIRTAYDDNVLEVNI